MFKGDKGEFRFLGAPGISKYQRLSKDADEGGSVVFGCDFFGHPLPTVRWTRGKETPLLGEKY